MRAWLCLFLPMAVSAAIFSRARNATHLRTDTAENASASMRGNQKNASNSQAVGAPKQHELLVCNAYPAGTLDVHVVIGEQKTSLASKLPYKSCQSFVQAMAVGDYLEFQTADVQKPVIVPSIPVADTTAMFVAYEKAPSGESAFNVWHHYFEPLKNAQVAVVDVAPPGATLEETSQPRASKLTCTNAMCGAGKVEVLPANTVEPLFPGQYEVKVGQEATALNLDLQPGKCYAVLRLNKNSLMVFPNAAPQKVYQSGAKTMSAASVLLAVMLGWVA